MRTYHGDVLEIEPVNLSVLSMIFCCVTELNVVCIQVHTRA